MLWPAFQSSPVYIATVPQCPTEFIWSLKANKCIQDFSVTGDIFTMFFHDRNTVAFTDISWYKHWSFGQANVSLLLIFWCFFQPISGFLWLQAARSSSCSCCCHVERACAYSTITCWPGEQKKPSVMLACRTEQSHTCRGTMSFQVRKLWEQLFGSVLFFFLESVVQTRVAMMWSKCLGKTSKAVSPFAFVMKQRLHTISVS